MLAWHIVRRANNMLAQELCQEFFWDFRSEAELEIRAALKA